MGQTLTKAYQKAQILNGAVAAAVVKELGDRLKTGKISKAEFVTQVVGFRLLAHNQAVKLAENFLAESRKDAGVGGEIVTPEFDREAVLASTFREVGQLTDEDVTDRFWDIVIGELAKVADSWAKNAGRRTVMESAEASGRRWRRVSDGNPCAFCAMLVGRGPVYRSKQSALRVVGRGKEIPTVRKRAKDGSWRGGKAKGIKSRGKQDLGEKYHDFCGCTVVEQIGPWTPTAEEQKFIDLYEANAGGSASEVLKRMRENGQGIINDAHIPEGKKKKPGPKPKTGSSGGGKKPPRRGAGAFKEMPEPPRNPQDGGDKDKWKAYWAERQDELPYDFRGQYVDADEVMSYERLARLGENLQPIPKKKSISTNDFVWVSNKSKETEMKSVSATAYESIMGRIHEAVKSARKHGVVKDVFLVDIGGQTLTRELHDQLRHYNLDRSNYAIRELWIMHSDGSEIDLIDLL